MHSDQTRSPGTCVVSLFHHSGSAGMFASPCFSPELRSPMFHPCSSFSPLFYLFCWLPNVHDDNPARVDFVCPRHKNFRPDDLVIEKAVEQKCVRRAIVFQEPTEMTSQVTLVVEGCDF